MPDLIFDAGPIISLSLNNLLWVLNKLKQRFHGRFVLPLAVHKELVERPLKGKKYKYEAFQVQRLVEQNILEVVDNKTIRQAAKKLSILANNCFTARNQPLRIVQDGEIEALALALMRDKVMVMDERITRMLVENPKSLGKRLEKRYHFPVQMNEGNIRDFQDKAKSVEIIRSVELVARAVELGMFNDKLIRIPNAKRELVDSLLWGLKLNGCAVSEQELRSLARRVS